MHKRQQWNFNPRSHERSDFDTSVTVSPIPYISIHAPTRGATVFGIDFPDFQSISIHAPTRGATLCVALLLQLFSISIHAPTRGATGTKCRVLADSIFQSTLPREERQTRKWSITIILVISIHAPTRGATLQQTMMKLPL